jgi:hypothetical protein
LILAFEPRVRAGARLRRMLLGRPPFAVGAELCRPPSEMPTMEHTPEALIPDSPSRPVSTSGAELPVVARLVVEVRSDGTTTIARAGLSDDTTGTTVMEARGSTPLALALDLARHIVGLTKMGPRTARALLAARRSTRGDDHRG